MLTTEVHYDILSTTKGDEGMAIGKDSNKIATIVSKEVFNMVNKLAVEEKRSISAMAAILIEKGLKGYNK